MRALSLPKGKASGPAVVLSFAWLGLSAGPELVEGQPESVALVLALRRGRAELRNRRFRKETGPPPLPLSLSPLPVGEGNQRGEGSRCLSDPNYAYGV